MDTLLEIIGFLDRYKVRQIDVLTNAHDNPSDPESRYFECYVGLREGRWQSEEEIALHFGMEPGSKAFSRFKNDLIRRLYNSTLYIDTSLPEFTDYSRAYAIVMQRRAIAMTLWARGAKHSFQQSAYQILDVARKFEFVDVAADMAMYLKANLVAYAQQSKEYEKIKALHTEYRQALNAELEVREAYESLIASLINKKGYKKEKAREAREWSIRLRPLAERYPHVILQKHYRLIDLYAEQLEHNWEIALNKARAASAFFKSKPFESKHLQMAFSQQEIGCLIMLGHFAEGKKVCNETLTLTTDGSYNWFKTRELSVVCDFYAGDYATAWKNCREIMRNTRYPEISAMDQESWRLFYGYLNLLSRMGQLSLSPREKGGVEKFRLSSWLNDMPLYSQDKRGANVPILIIQAIFLLLDNRTEEFDNRVEALRKYRQRNLDPDNEHFRTHCFIRLLELVVKHGYRAGPTAHEAKKWLTMMGSVSNDLLDRSFEIEVVPYERQWEWVMEILRH